MIATALTVRDLFLSTDHGELSAKLQLPEVPTGLSHLLTRFEWNGLAERVADLLEINVVDVLLAGWKKHKEVRMQMRTTAADPTRTAMVSLGRHTVHSTHKPSIEVRSYGRRLVELSFPIDLTFDIEAVELTLRAGAVTHIRSGELKVRGTVKLESAVIFERSLEPIQLPGRIALETVPPGGDLRSDEPHDSSATVM